MIWQALCLYEAALPSYQAWLSAWEKEVETWERCARQVTKARKALKSADWEEQVKQALAIGGPWTRELVEELFHSALAVDDLTPRVAWERLGPLSRWAEEGLDAAEIKQRLGDYAADALIPWVDLGVDVALARQFPDEDALEDWLAAFVAQASPFLRYDETALAEGARSHVYRETWLLLPGGGDTFPRPDGLRTPGHGEGGTDQGKLARACQTWPHPPTMLPGQTPAELVAVVLRWGLPLTTLSDLGFGKIKGEQGPATQGMRDAEGEDSEDSKIWGGGVLC
jgi:hypothetical protein